MAELPFYTNWSYAHPRAIELAAKVAELAPGDLNRVFFVSGGSEANEAIIKLVKQYHQLHGAPPPLQDDRAPHRLPRHHAGRALADRHLPAAHAVRAAACPASATSPTPTATGGPTARREQEFTQFLLDELRDVIEQEGPESVAAVFMEPVQNSGGTFTPPEGYYQGVRAICDEYGVLLVADEVICGFGRLGEWFGSDPLRHPARPRHLRQGRRLGLRAAGRRADDRQGGRALPRGQRPCSTTASPTAATPWPAPWRSRTSR